MVARTPQDGVTMARMLPGASFAAGGWQGPDAHREPHLSSVSLRPPQTGMETAPGPRGSCCFSRFGFSGSKTQGKSWQFWEVFWLLRRLWQQWSRERTLSRHFRRRSQGQEEGPFLWESGLRSARCRAGWGDPGSL